MRPLLLLIILLLTGCATTGGPGGGTVTSEAIAASSQLYRQAIAAYRKKQLMQAFELASAAVEKNPANAEAWGLVGLINQRLDQPEGAEKAFRRALQLTPDDPALLNNQAGFFCSQKRWEEAQQTFARAANLDNNPAPEIAWTNAGLCARRAGDPQLAEALLKKAIQHNSGLPTALYQLASIALEKGKPVEASTWLNQYLDHAVHTPKTLLLGARIEQALGNPAGVAAYVERLRSAFPDSPERQQAEALSPIARKTAGATPNIHGGNWLATRDPNHYTVQVGSYGSLEAARQIAGKLRPPVAIQQLGGRYIVYQGDYPTLSLARTAQQVLQQRAGNAAAPWVRDFGGIQKGAAK